MSELPKKTRVALVVGAMVFVACAWFHHEFSGWNVTSRLALTYAVVEQGTLSIDAYHANPAMPYMETGDKAFYNGRFYCDKAPALSFTAVPVYWVAYQAREWFGWFADLPHETWVDATRYLCRVTTSSVAAGVLAAVLFLTALRLGVGCRLAALLGGGLVLGTLLYGYATLFYAYLPGALCAALAYYLLLGERLRQQESQEAVAVSVLWWSGCLTGFAWFYNFTFGLAGVGLGCYALLLCRRKAWRIWPFVLGGLFWVGVYAIYSFTIFETFAVPYSFEHDPWFQKYMSEGFQGIKGPRLDVLYYITIHPFHGLFFYSPMLLLWFAGLWTGFRRARGWWPDLLLSGGVVVGYFVFNAGYYQWWGGWAALPRLMCPALPFFLPAIAIWLREGGRLRLSVFGVLLGVSVFWNFVITAHNPQLPTYGLPNEWLITAPFDPPIPATILTRLVPDFFNGQIARNIGAYLLRLPGHLSLAPLLLLLLVGYGWILRRGCRTRHQ